MNAKRDQTRQHAPRSGGRAVARESAAVDSTRQHGATQEHEAQQYGTQGSAALAPEARPPDQPKAGRGVPWLKVAPPVPVSVPRAPFVALLLLVVVGGVLGILLVNTKINENAFQLRNLEQEQSALDRQEQDLKQRIANYESPNNLAAQARRLGLVPAESPAFIRLPDGRLIGVPQPAGGEPSITSEDQQAAGR